jgi:hypothetical protein
MRSDYFKRFWTENQDALNVFAAGMVHVATGRIVFQQH